MKASKFAKRILPGFILATLLVIFTLFGSVSADDMQSGKAFSGTAVIDGTNTSGEWDGIPSYPVTRCMDGSDTGTTGSFQMMWDGSYIYMLVQVNDSSVSDQGEIDKSDNIQIYIDPNLSKNSEYSATDYQWEITRSSKAMGISDAPAFAEKPELFTDNCEYKVTSSATGWTCEYKANLSAINGKALTADMVMGLDVQVNDIGTDSDARLAAYGWNDSTNGVWGNPSLMGEIKLSSESVSVAAPEATEAPAAPEVTSPKTGDSSALFIVLAAAALVSGVLAFRRRSSI
ncbi:MAG: sugar-binding protein [Eubacteriales bacterium]